MFLACVHMKVRSEEGATGDPIESARLETINNNNNNNNIILLFNCFTNCLIVSKSL